MTWNVSDVQIQKGQPSPHDLFFIKKQKLGTRVEKFMMNFFENDCFKKIPYFRSISFTLRPPKITHRLFIELRLTNITIFRKFGAKLAGFQHARNNICKNSERNFFFDL